MTLKAKTKLPPGSKAWNSKPINRTKPASVSNAQAERDEKREIDERHRRLKAEFYERHPELAS